VWCTFRSPRGFIVFNRRIFIVFTFILTLSFASFNVQTAAYAKEDSAGCRSLNGLSQPAPYLNLIFTQTNYFEKDETITATAVDGGTVYITGIADLLTFQYAYTLGSKVSFTIPASGDYQILIGSLYSSLTGHIEVTCGGLGPRVPAGFVQRAVTCNTAVFNLPDGTAVSDATLKTGQHWYVNPAAIKGKARSWMEVFVAGYTTGYIPAECVQ